MKTKIGDIENGIRSIIDENRSKPKKISPSALIADLEAKLKAAMEAVYAYRTLSTCYRTGRQPSEKLFKELAKAADTIDDFEQIKAK